MIDLRQHNEPRPSFKEKLWQDALNYIREQTAIKLSLMILGVIMGTIMFIGGVPLMVTDVVAYFPIPQILHYPIGTILMLVLVMIAKLLTQELADVMFAHSRYNRVYRMMLFITTLLCLFFTWAVQTEATDNATDTELEQGMEALQLDSANIKAIDASLADASKQIAVASATITQYNIAKAGRKGQWVSNSETSLMQSANKLKSQAIAIKASLTSKRLEEIERLNKQQEAYEQKLKEQKQKKLTEGKQTAGLAELILVVVAFFLAAYRNRFRKQTVEEQEIMKPFPSGLSIGERQEKLKLMKPLGFDEEEMHLLVEVAGERFYHSIPDLVKSIGVYRSRIKTAKSEESRDTQLRNIHYTEQVLAMTPLEIEDFDRLFRYKPMFPDYWNNTSGNVSQHVADTLQKQQLNVVQRKETVDIDLFA